MTRPAWSLSTSTPHPHCGDMSVVLNLAGSSGPTCGRHLWMTFDCSANTGGGECNPGCYNLVMLGQLAPGQAISQQVSDHPSDLGSNCVLSSPKPTKNRTKFRYRGFPSSMLGASSSGQAGARDVVTWNTLMNAYAQHGDGQMAISCLQKMQQQGTKPTVVTFICLLVACSHEGLVNEGKRYFRLLVEDHGLTLDVFHYNCIVDLLGRSGHLDEAENVLRTVPIDTDTVGWTALLTACKSHGDIERGRRCFNRLAKLEPKNSTPYVLLASMYANVGRWNDVDRIESLRKAAGAKKKPAKACIEVNSKLHEFTVGEERADLSTKMRNVNLTLKEGGHVPHTELVLKAVSERDKENALCGHAEKLALAYGLLNTPDGTTLLVTKNLRMCNDCHSGTKVMSRLEKREIIVRDSHRVHRFVEGACSCGDRH